MSQGQITLTQYSDNIAYCRMSTDADPAGVFTQNDTEAVSIGGTPFALWTDNDDILYVGKASTFAYVGFRVGTAASGYGAFTLWYSITSVQYAIATATAATDTITITGDYTAKFKEGYQFRIAGSTGNDGIWTCDADSTFGGGATSIVTAEDLTDDTDDGNVPAHSIWGPLTALFNSTSSFTVSGYLAWSVPGDWGLSSITDTGAYGGAATSAYWIKATQAEAAPATPATAEHLLRNITLDPPLHVQGPNWTLDRTYADINGTLQKVDITYKGPQQYIIGISQMALGTLMTELNILIDWEYGRNRIFIEDEAVTSPIEISTDSYYRTMQGMLVGVPEEMKSPSKMGLSPGAYYPLLFKIDTVVTQSSTLGLTL